ncbi:MAG: 3-hydroxyacyl-ACP dehydratase FabZ [Magnetococcales bacterium]|nr:3-hydroxyacyl-ACP dehydratase FabZ [Magnetococcales bacterium]
MVKSDEIQEILQALPHRYPFLLVDRILSVEDNQRIVAIKNVTFNEPQFTGHFPDHPVMPGVLILEAMAQASALLASRIDPEAVRGRLVYFMAIDGARFRKPVVPGDQMRIEMTLLKRRGDVWKFTGKVTTDNQVAAEAELMAMVRDRDKGESS